MNLNRPTSFVFLCITCSAYYVNDIVILLIIKEHLMVNTVVVWAPRGLVVFIFLNKSHVIHQDNGELPPTCKYHQHVVNTTNVSPKIVYIFIGQTRDG